MKVTGHELQVRSLGGEYPLEKEMLNTCIKHLPNCTLYMQFITCKLYLNKFFKKDLPSQVPGSTSYSLPYVDCINTSTEFCATSLQSYLTLCKPLDCSPPDSSVCGILQARILEWVAMPSSRRSSQPRDRTCVSCIGRQVLYH